MLRFGILIRFPITIHGTIHNVKRTIMFNKFHMFCFWKFQGITIVLIRVKGRSTEPGDPSSLPVVENHTRCSFCIGLSSSNKFSPKLCQFFKKVIHISPVRNTIGGDYVFGFHNLKNGVYNVSLVPISQAFYTHNTF
ncbi:hypothetical protein TRSC58_06849 [Trypanosoma rangeli SC58]|uniref:Uncharacterized protein n=1 Tax=Trypanosoma rangeli SC58 TaxID=429131 RepID=A0A061IU01_TRYRA|nr:hypothetical protein TRSC58_06849 [Trypanosoma rangeli SC58]